MKFKIRTSAGIGSEILCGKRSECGLAGRRTEAGSSSARSARSRGIAVSNEHDPTMKNFALVATFTTEFEAKLVEMKLAESGIPSFLQAPDVYPPMDFRRGIKIFVNPEDLERATAILKEDGSDLQEDSDTSGGLGLG